MLSGGNDDDVSKGGSRADTFVFNADTADAVDTITDFSSVDSLVLRASNPVEVVQLADNVGLFANDLQFASIQNATTQDVNDALF